MISSGITRGLATTAVAALAVTGLPSLALANPVNAQVGAGNVELYSQFSGKASMKNDGQNTTVRLEAGAGSDVSSVKFQYSNDGVTFIDIATVATRDDDGAFSHEWNAAGLAGATVTLRALGTKTSGGTSSDDQAGVQIAGGGAGVESVNITDATELGVFQAPYNGNPQNVIVHGTTSATAGDVTIGRLDGSGALVNPATAPVTKPTGSSTGVFTGVVDITGYTYGSPDELVLGAERGSDDVESVGLYKQSIGSVAASADRTTVPAGQTAKITVSVDDQKGNPIAGAEVRDSAGALVGYTGATGKVTTTQGPGSKYYYANATSSAPYEEALGDKKSDTITVAQYNPKPSSLAASSADGVAFDRDENDGNDIQVQVKDQNGNNFDTTGQALQYHWVITPFAGGTPTRVPAAGSSTQPIENDGKFDVMLPAGPDGTYELFAGLSADALGNNGIASSKVLTVKAGQASLKWAEQSPEQAPAGTTEVVEGTLALADGTGLPGRNVQLDFTQGAESGAGANGADAGIVAADGTVVATRTVKTAADGGLSATIKDAAQSPQPAEKGGRLDAQTTNTPDIGNADAASPSQGVDFLLSVTPGAVSISPVAGGMATPGEIRDFEIEVTDGRSPATVLTNTEVTVAIDHGFFTNGQPDPAAAAGNDYREWKSLGQSITVKTDGNGMATVRVAIERDTGFDDDGRVTAELTATAGPVSKSATQLWDSSNPFNGGEVELVLSPDALQQSGVLPSAPLSDWVAMDVFVTDQFGNRVEGERVEITDNVGNATINWGNSATVWSNLDLDADVYLNSSAAQDQVVKATWMADTEKYNGATPPAPVPGTETLTDTSTVNWYAVDFANSTYSLSHSGGDVQEVGSTVKTTYVAKDQKGEPISDLYVEFFRTGPDDQQDGSGNFDDFLGQDGTLVYVYQGAKAGKAIVSTIGRDGGANEAIVEQAELTDTVQFGDDTPPEPEKEKVIAVLKATNNGGGADLLRVETSTKAEGATVKLFKRTGSGVKKLLQTGEIGTDGKAEFIANDSNGRGFTKYFAKVKPTDDTKGARTNARNVR